jgi:hypothetical protein
LSYKRSFRKQTLNVTKYFARLSLESEMNKSKIRAQKRCNVHQCGRKLRSSGQSDGIVNQPKPRFLVIPSLLYCKNNERTSFLHILAGGHQVSFPQSLAGKSLYSVQCTVYSVQCTVHSVQCTVHSVQCT